MITGSNHKVQILFCSDFWKFEIQCRIWRTASQSPEIFIKSLMHSSSDFLKVLTSLRHTVGQDFRTLWTKGNVRLQRWYGESVQWKENVFKECYWTKIECKYRVSHSKDCKVILLWWEYRFWFLLIFWVLCVHEIRAFMPNLSVLIFLILPAVW